MSYPLGKGQRDRYAHESESNEKLSKTRDSMRENGAERQKKEMTQEENI